MTSDAELLAGDLDDVVLIGSGRDLGTIPGSAFREAVVGLPARMGLRRAFMTEPHVRVREYVVREMRAGGPLPPQRIASAIDLPVPTVVKLLADLERNLFFLVRAEDGAVTWAFPVTAEPTRHLLKLPGEELLYAA